MNPQEILQNLTEQEIGALNQRLYEDKMAGSAVREILESDGWVNYIAPMIDALIQKTKSIDGIETIDELKARQISASALESFFKALDGLVMKEKTAMDTIKDLQLEEPQ